MQPIYTNTLRSVAPALLPGVADRLAALILLSLEGITVDVRNRALLLLAVLVLISLIVG